MFHRSQSTLFFLVAFVVALAVAAPGRRTEPPSSCGTGPQQCCNSVQEARDVKSDALGVKNVAILLIALLGLKPDTLVGLTCSPVGLLGNSQCNSQAVCCQNNNFNGLIATGCTPINVDL